MISVRRFLLTVFIAIFVFLGVVFWLNLARTQQHVEDLVATDLRAIFSEMSYHLTRELSRGANVGTLRAVLQRHTAPRDALAAIMLVQDGRVLLTTDPDFDQVPSPADTVRLGQADNSTLLAARASDGVIQYYSNGKPKTLRMIMLSDRDYIEQISGARASRIVFNYALPALLSLLLLWVLLDVFLSQPLRRLNRLVQREDNYKPGKFFLREFNTLSNTLLSTFERLDDEKAQLYTLSTTDPLSGLANRESLDDRLGWLIADAERKQSEFALFFMDLDNFKLVNDSFGHKVGDQLLVQIADSLRQIVRTGDIIARLGGDEFILVIKDYDTHEELAGVAHRILNRLHDRWQIDSYQLTVSGSIGIALYPRDGTDSVQLIKNADIAMYQAKEGGRDRYCYFTDEVNQQITSDLTLATDMRGALKNGEFELYYQPKVAVSSGTIVGVEALVRWNHPEHGLLLPGRFIPLAEKNGFIVSLGVWILKQAVRQQVAWKASGELDIRMSVNVSAAQFHDDAFDTLLQSILTEYDMAANKLDLEITESLLLRDTDVYHERMRRIHQMGVQFSLDDFGTGYSALAYLKIFPIDVLKIDCIFIRDFDTPQGAIFIETMVKMAHTLGLAVVCEGVESHEQLAYLRKIGCEVYQGNLCSPPLPADQFLRLYKKQFVGNSHADHPSGTDQPPV